MSDKDTGTEVSATPYLAPENEIKMTEEPYPPIGFRVFSQEGVGERPGVTKADLKAEEPVAYAPVEPESYEPGKYTITEVKDYVTANPDQRDAVLAAEQEGSNRSTLVKWLSEEN